MYRPYNRNVLIGNWFEDRALEEDIIKDYLDKKNRGELASQKAQTNQVLPATLTTVNDNRVHSGDIIMLKCDGNVNSASPLLPKAYRNDCFIVENVGAAGGISSQVPTTISAFIVKSVDGSPLGSSIKFGQPFIITTLCGTKFLHSDPLSYDKAARRSRMQIVDFVSVYNHECDWVATCLNPKFRLEAEGSDIPANEKIIILNMKTNKALAVHCDFNNKSRFEIVAHTFLDSHKAEEDVNHWKFVTNLPTVPVPE
ncbi:unnamed protein product [Brachionus calyciflorus]|uniref:Cilia- and flagella-associated protein 161 n=1 Tax=Brachionus calyciflorus TaxID=104777 RepID=A0A813MQ14_9BILA|nr:unnamed protein product [Brachionus calyciflorus]